MISVGDKVRILTGKRAGDMGEVQFRTSLRRCFLVRFADGGTEAYMGDALERLDGENMADDSRDKHREARRLFKESKETFFDAHEKGMPSLEAPEGREQAEGLDDAIEQERRAVEKMSEAVELQREAFEEQRDTAEELEGAGRSLQTHSRHKVRDYGMSYGRVRRLKS